ITDDHCAPAPTQELLSRAREGEAPAFCLLIGPLQGRLLQQAVALCGGLSAAEDLVSETLVEAWKSLSRYDQTCRLSTWLYSILLHRHQHALRRARSRPISLAWLPWLEARKLRDQHQNVASSEPSPAEVAVRNEFSRQVRRCIET